jgi:hypothetical protein
MTEPSVSGEFLDIVKSNIQTLNDYYDRQELRHRTWRITPGDVSDDVMALIDAWWMVYEPALARGLLALAWTHDVPADHCRPRQDGWPALYP